MKLNTLCANLVGWLGIPMSEMTELQRALKEGSSKFGEDLITEDEHRAILHEAAQNKLNADILKARPGPGGGVDADPFRSTFVIIALMAGGPRHSAALATWTAWHLPQEGSVLSGVSWGSEPELKEILCPLTGQSLFGDAIEALVADEDLACRVQEVRLSRYSAEINYDDGEISRFQIDDRAPNSHKLYRIAVLHGEIIQAVSSLLKRKS